MDLSLISPAPSCQSRTNLDWRKEASVKLLIAALFAVLGLAGCIAVPYAPPAGYYYGPSASADFHYHYGPRQRRYYYYD